MTNKFWEDFVADSRPPSNGALRLPAHRFSPAEIEEICSKFKDKTDVDLNNEITVLIEQYEEYLKRFKSYPVQPELVEHFEYLNHRIREINHRIREIKTCLKTRWIERMARGQQQSENPPCT